MQKKTWEKIITVYVWASIVIAIILAYHLVYRVDIINLWSRLVTGEDFLP